jgi:hypothetical protein
VIHPIILWQLARNGTALEPPRRAATGRRVWRQLGRPGRGRATDDPTAPPREARDPLAVAALHTRVAHAAVLAGRPEAAAAACRAALEALEGGPPRLDVVVTSRTNRAPATCDAPNCAGHRTRA